MIYFAFAGGFFFSIIMLLSIGIYHRVKVVRIEERDPDNYNIKVYHDRACNQIRVSVSDWNMIMKLCARAARIERNDRLLVNNFHGNRVN